MADETKAQEAPSVQMITSGPTPGVWVADADYTETLPDGRVIQHAVKGAGYPLHQADAIRAVAGPAETKEDVKREPAPPVSETAAKPAKEGK